MNQEAYRHLWRTFGQAWGERLGYLLELINVLIVRVYVVIVVAQLTASLAEGNIEAAKRDVLYYLIAYIIGSVAGSLGDLVCLHTENIVYGHLAQDFHGRLINKDMHFFRDSQTGYLTSAFRQYLDSAMLLIRYFRGEALGATVSLLVPALVLLIADWRVGLIASAVVLVQALYILWSSKRANPYRVRSHEVYRQLTGEVADELTNIIAFKSAGIEATAQRRISKLIGDEVEVFWKRQKVMTLLDFPRGIITSLATAAAIYVIVSGGSVRNPHALGLIVLTLTYMFQILRNIGALPALITQHDDLVTKLYPTLHYLERADTTIEDPAEPVPLHTTAAAINIDGVSFGYLSQTKAQRIPVFRDFTLHIAGGEQIGIVGLSGAGKSTLANLLLRFDDVDKGRITIDGTDIRSVTQSDLRNAIAYVPQEPLLFHRSVRENIAYYNESAGEADIVRAAKAAHAHDFIMKLPDGYDTLVGERGVKLSGGQKQRIAIARAVLKQSPIMIFDEATSALDSESERIIQRALPAILGKQTAIIIAHRLSTIAGLDRIIVMHDGKIVEHGTHEQLLTRKGRYYSLWQKQTLGSDASDD